MVERTVLLDGNSLVYRAFHALPLLDNGKGEYTNAAFGFMSMLFKVLEEYSPKYLAVAFDMYGPTFRHDSFADYKAGRKPTPDELIPQFPMVKELLCAMGITIFEKQGFEGDDILGTISKISEGLGIPSLVVTGDRDCLQLVSELTHVLYTKRGITDTEEFTTQGVKAKYGITPSQVTDMKGLMGDPSDNIPGVPGIGEVTALKLLTQHPTLEEVLDTAEAEQKGKLRERLMEHRELALLSKQLGTIKRDVPLDFTLNDLTIKNILSVVPSLERLGMKSLATKLNKLSILYQEVPPQTTEVATIVEAKEEQQVAGKDIPKPTGVIALDISHDLSLAFSNGDTYRIPISYNLLTNGIALEDALASISHILLCPAPKVVHDAKGLYWFLDKLGLKINNVIHDTMIAAYVLQPQLKSFTLSALLGGQTECSARDMLALMQVQLKQLEETSTLSLFQDIEMKLIHVLFEMEKTGFLIDQVELARLGDTYAQRIQELQGEIAAMTGYQINLNSPKQLGELLFEKLGLPTQRKTRTGYSTDAEALEQLQELSPVIPLILEFRRLSKLNSTYIEGLRRLVATDGRVHTNFIQTAAATGRISSQEPNLQNIPIRTEQGKDIRKAFIAKEGCVLVDADYSQIELRVLAHMSQDVAMVDAFNRGQDIHLRTASEVYSVPLNEVTHEMRSAAKAVNFGIVYGISDFGLARNIGVTRSEAKQFIQRYLERYPNIKKYMDEMVTLGETQGYVETMLKRRRYIPELTHSNFNTRSFGKRVAMNSPIQGTAADIIKLAMVKVQEQLELGNYKARLILQVHDELIIEAPCAELEAVSELTKKSMEGVLQLLVPLTADVHSGVSWNDSK